MEGAAVALAGASGRGKSTLASALAMEGHALLSDDVCRITFSEGKPMAFPGPPRLRLWPDMVKALGKNPDDLAPARVGHAKQVQTDSHPDTQLRPLRVLVRLGTDARASQPFIEELKGPSGVMPIDDLVYRTRLGRRMGRRTEIFKNLMQLGNSVRIFRLVRPEGPADFPQLTGLVTAAVQAA
jgi:hypothetical protein